MKVGQKLGQTGRDVCDWIGKRGFERGNDDVDLRGFAQNGCLPTIPVQPCQHVADKATQAFVRKLRYPNGQGSQRHALSASYETRRLFYTTGVIDSGGITGL